MPEQERYRNRLRLSAATAAGCLALGVSSPAPAQTAAAQSAAVPADPAAATPTPATQRQANKGATVNLQAPPQQAPVEQVTVTGSILRNPNLAGASPVTRLSMQDMKARGITTIADALQQLSANNSGNLPSSFSGNGAFANGASGVSLRGLTVDSTLVLIDGQRAAYYPLADDGERNFVDINSIPQSIVQSVDVEQDGASATYGADAVAGVVNIITRKQIEGFEGGAEGGLSQRGDAGHQRLYATYGYGNLNSDGYNVYINGEYQNDDPLYNRDRGYPYNTGNLSGIDGTNGNANGLQANGGISGVSATRVALVSPLNADGSSGLYQPINASLGCNGLATHTVSAGTVCEQDLVHDYRIIQPMDRRISGTIRGTANLSDRAQAYAMFTYSQNLVAFNGASSSGAPSSIRQQSASGDISLSSITLPVYLANGQLNPQNPFAAQGLPANILYRFADLDPTTEDFNQTFRGSAGINGSIGSNWGGDWDYNASFVGMTDTLRRTITGVPTYQGVLDAVANGTYNFMDPSQNTAAVRNAIAPKVVQYANSQEYSADFTLSKGLFRLPGGMTTLGIGGQARYESLNDPSANPDDPSDPAAQYLPQVNGFGAVGSRRVGSAFFEVGAPLVKQLTVNVSGRYDNYSEGFDNFAPKVGVIFKPVKQFTLRGTYSKGFRVPSFAETGALPTIGYISYTPTDPAFLAQHQAAGGGADAYAQTYSLGLNSVGNPHLQPEKTDNFTGGAVLQPKPWLSLTADYYYIKKKNYITLADYSTPVADYFSGAGYPAGISVTPDVADPDHPNATPRPGIVTLSYINAAKLVTDGIDVQLAARVPLPGKLRDITWRSTGEATYVMDYRVTYPGLGTENYAGTLGPANVTSASGTPRWRANWQNTFTYKKLSTTVTAYYTSGYKLTAEDVTGPGTESDCSQAQQGFNGDPLRCHVDAFVDVDWNISYQVTKNLNAYLNIYNVFDSGPPLDTGTYGGYQYNPAWAQSGILGRSFRFGVTTKF